MPQTGGTDNKVRETAASEILSEIERTAERVKKTAEYVAEKTSSVTSVTMEGPEREAVAASKNPPDAYPPLFSRLRILVDSINESLGRIEDNMRRCEL